MPCVTQEECWRPRERQDFWLTLCFVPYSPVLAVGGCLQLYAAVSVQLVHGSTHLVLIRSRAATQAQLLDKLDTAICPLQLYSYDINTYLQLEGTA